MSMHHATTHFDNITNPLNRLTERENERHRATGMLQYYARQVLREMEILGYIQPETLEKLKLATDRSEKSYN